MTPDPEAVAALLRRAATEIILPRFKNLEKGDVREKGPGDLVTIADTEAEQMLPRCCANSPPARSWSARRRSPAIPPSSTT